MAKTIDAARRHWRGILGTFGVDLKLLTGKHGPCPLCAGRDRFRFDDNGGNGTWICNVCGAGNGMKLLMEFKGWNFRTAAGEVDKIIGNVEPDPAPKKMNEETQKRLLNDLWVASTPIVAGDQAFQYLSSRVKLPPSLPACLRFAPSCPAPDHVKRPALLAMVKDPAGEPANIHRTFLGANGKADIQTPRAMMPGTIPPGSAVRLFKAHGDRLGIAEGIETAFAAAAKFRMPFWSAINSTMLAKWKPPETVREVWVFGDNDPKYGGQAAAYDLAHRLAARFRLEVEVKIPPRAGRDWADRDAG